MYLAKAENLGFVRRRMSTRSLCFPRNYPVRNRIQIMMSISAQKSDSWTTEAKLAGFLTELEKQIKWTKDLKGILPNTY